MFPFRSSTACSLRQPTARDGLPSAYRAKPSGRPPSRRWPPVRPQWLRGWLRWSRRPCAGRARPCRRHFRLRPPRQASLNRLPKLSAVSCFPDIPQMKASSVVGPASSVAWSTGRIGIVHPHAGLLGLDRNHTIADMLLADHRGIAAAQAGVQEHVEHDPLARPTGPAPLEGRDLFVGPNRESSCLRTFLTSWQRYPACRIGSDEIGIHCPGEQTAHGAQEVLRLGRGICTGCSRPFKIAFLSIRDSSSRPADLRTWSMMFSRCLRVAIDKSRQAIDCQSSHSHSSVPLGTFSGGWLAGRRPAWSPAEIPAIRSPRLCGIRRPLSHGRTRRSYR